VVVGGASLVGGKGDPLSCVIGVFVLATIVNIMNLVGISSEPQLVIKGAVIIAAVFLSSAGGVERISNALARLTGREDLRAPGLAPLDEPWRHQLRHLALWAVADAVRNR
jgi:ribose transport system permease protein